MKKILLIGGTGAIGVYLIDACVKLGYEVFVTSRKSILNQANLTYLQGDGFDQSFLSNILSSYKFDAVVDFMVYNTQQFEQRIDLLLGHTDHYVFISTYRVFANLDLTPIVEDSPRLLDTIKDEEYLNTDEYGLTKARQEDILNRSKYKNWTIVRPSVSYSTSRFQFGTFEAEQFLKRAQHGISVPMSDEVMNRYTTMTWSGDVAKMISKLIFDARSYCEDFNVVTSEHHLWRSVSRIYENLIGLKVKEVTNERFAKITPNKWQLKYDRMFNRICDNSKILNFCQLKQNDLMPLSQGLSLELGKTKLFDTLSQSFPSNYDGKLDKVMSSFETIRVKSTLKNKLKYINGRFR